MTPSPRRAATAVAAALSVLAGLALGAAAIPADAAPAADVAVGSEVAVALSQQLPLEPRPGDTLTISGVVTNASASPVADVAVRLRLSPTPVRHRDELASILAGEAGRTGIAVQGTRVELSPRLAPGARAPFTITVPLDDLALPADRDEVVVVGVESLADVADDGRGVRQAGFTRSFLPWFPEPAQVAPTKVALLLPLSTAPARASDNVFLDDHLGDEVVTGGRLDRILDAAEAAPAAVSWVVDPALLESLVDMSDGYEVMTAEGTVPGTRSAAAGAWLARLRSATAGAGVDVTASAYAVPDVVALHRAGLDLDIALASSTAAALPAEVLGRPVAHGLGWPIGGLADDGTLDALRAAGSTVVALSAASLPPSRELTYTPSGLVDLGSGSSPLRAVLTDPALSALVAAPRAGAEAADPVVRRQTAIAQLAMITLELPSTARTIAIAPGAWWSVDGTATRDLVETLASPWSTPAALADVVAAPASDIPRDRADYPAKAQEAELSQGYLDAVAKARGRLADLRSVAPDTGGTTIALEAGLTRTESGAWRSDRTTGRRLLGVVSGQIDAEIAQVQVLSRAPITLPGDSGVIPVTVANDLDRPARVGVRLIGTPSVRFESEALDPVTVGPGQKRTLEVQARVLGTGPVTVQIALLTPEGDVFGTPVTTEVRSAAYARAAQSVVIGLFGILVVLLAVNLLRRRSAARRSGDDDDGAGGSSEGGAA